MKNNNNQDAKVKVRYVPFEIKTEILIRLPAKSLGRFQSVCKSWCNLIKDRNFGVLQMERSMLKQVYEVKYTSIDSQPEEQFLHQIHGMILEKIVSTGKFRIRNPTTNYNLILPDPERQCYAMRMFYLPKTDDYKLASMDLRKHNVIGCQVLRIGTDSTWRDIVSFSETSVYALSQVEALVFYIILNSKIVCLEIETEKFVYVKKPQGMTMDWKHLNVFSWGEENKLAITHLTEQVMQVWILEDYKKKVWSERKIEIPLSLFGDCGPLTLKTLCPYCLLSNGKASWLWFKRKDDLHIAYNIDTKQEFRVSAPAGERFMYRYIPTLLNCGEEVNVKAKNEQLGQQ